MITEGGLDKIIAGTTGGSKEIRQEVLSGKTYGVRFVTM